MRCTGACSRARIPDLRPGFLHIEGPRTALAFGVPFQVLWSGLGGAK